MPYRIDIESASPEALDRLIELGALDIEVSDTTTAALIPDAVAVHSIAEALGRSDLRVSPAVGRDDGSVWTLQPRAVRTRSLLIVPKGMAAPPDALTLVDGAAFGTGLHPTTVMCLEALEDVVAASVPARLLDVGTGSGILALAALRLGVPKAVGVEIDAAALRVAATNARLNGLNERLRLVRGDAAAVRGSWPVVVANLRAAEVIEMAPTLVRRVASRGRVVLSGIPHAVAPDVRRVYERLGTRLVHVRERVGWVALELMPSW